VALSRQAHQLGRVRRLCLALPETSERLSHGEPTFYVRQKVFVKFADNHHADGRIARWIQAPPGAQATLTKQDPAAYFRPPYVGAKGRVGLELGRIDDQDLAFYVQMAWEMAAPDARVTATAPT